MYSQGKDVAKWRREIARWQGAGKGALEYIFWTQTTRSDFSVILREIVCDLSVLFNYRTVN